jgi:hypothetical protein
MIRNSVRSRQKRKACNHILAMFALSNIWVDHLGRPREYLFLGVESRVVARIDFQLRLMDQGEPVPNEFELEEATIVLPKIIGERKRI